MKITNKNIFPKESDEKEIKGHIKNIHPAQYICCILNYMDRAALNINLGSDFRQYFVDGCK